MVVHKEGWMVKTGEGFFILSTIRWDKPQAIDAALRMFYWESEDPEDRRHWRALRRLGHRCVRVRVEEIVRRAAEVCKKCGVAKVEAGVSYCGECGENYE
jgi:hypothetical protein